ncbi:CBP20 [Scenedesmus sp. PABB004]|nr:CBP20 [Scenedesmus sp. PABB004]
MAKLMKMLQPLQSDYVDRRFDGTKEEYFEQLEKSSTLYIGNLSFYTTEDQVYELFGKVGPVARVIMGLDRNTKTPCGFCFVTYHTRAAALAAVRALNGTKLDGRALRADIDYGFEEGRQFGRGRSGGQVRDEFRTDYDAERGGYGRAVAQQLAASQLAMWAEVQAGAGMGAAPLLDGPGGGVFFGQAQRAAGGRPAAAGGEPGGEGEQEQQPLEPAPDGDAGAEEEEDGGGGAAANPRLRGRGGAADDEDDEAGFEEQLRRKRQRTGPGPAAPDGAAEQPQPDAEPDAAAAEGVEEML